MAATSSSTAARREVGGIGPSMPTPKLPRRPAALAGSIDVIAGRPCCLPGFAIPREPGEQQEERRHGGAIAAGHLPCGLHRVAAALRVHLVRDAPLRAWPRSWPRVAPLALIIPALLYVSTVATRKSDLAGLRAPSTESRGPSGAARNGTPPAAEPPPRVAEAPPAAGSTPPPPPPPSSAAPPVRPEFATIASGRSTRRKGRWRAARCRDRRQGRPRHRGLSGTSCPSSTARTGCARRSRSASLTTERARAAGARARPGDGAEDATRCPASSAPSRSASPTSRSPSTSRPKTPSSTSPSRS